MGKNEHEARPLGLRAVGLGVLLAALFLGAVWILFQVQIVNGKAYAASSARNIANLETVDAARGIITDRYGRVLVDNRTTYRVTLDTSVMGESANDVLLRLTQLCREKSVTWQDRLPISAGAPFAFTTDSPYTSVSTDAETGKSTVSYTRLGKLVRALKWEEGLSASRLMEQFRAAYSIGEEYTDDQARTLAGIYYELALRDRELDYSQYVFASDVDIDFISVVKEEGLPGVTIKTAYTREYKTTYAAHLLGTVGAIRAEEWDKYKDLGYDMDDIVGRDGAEAAFESELRGVSGTKQVEYDKNGLIISETYADEPQPGNNVALTLDIKLQEVTEQALAAYVPEMNNGEEGAAAVVIDVKDGGVLACASYPTYDLSTFNRDYNDLAADPLQPMYNRALLGIYSPGSTFKMVTAAAGLEEGLITPSTQILDKGVYHYYDAAPKCWIYNQSRSTHGLETVSDAIRDSCNYFFYDVGVNLGIDKLDEYAKAFGLGSPTGVELPESKGILAGPEYSASVGSTWYQGNVLYAAIGQGDNSFTPIQLANYVATLVNGGSHYAAHFLQNVKSYDYSTLVRQYEPQLLNTVELQPKNLAAIKTGMYQVTENTPAVKAAFERLGMKVGAKTGTAQRTSVSTKNNNSVFVCFAPYDEPEIAIAIVVGKGGSGASSAQIAADIMAYYFQSTAALDAAVGENQLIP